MGTGLGVGGVAIAGVWEQVEAVTYVAVAVGGVGAPSMGVPPLHDTLLYSIVLIYCFSVTKGGGGGLDRRFWRYVLIECSLM